VDHERTSEVDILDLVSTTVKFGTVAAHKSATRTECNIQTDSEADGDTFRAQSS
jgi:hypothetical protein